MSRALASLTGLTTLVFGCFPLLSLPLEATIRPPGLQRLLFFTPLMPPDPGALRWETSNPRSCYLAHIRWLGLPYVVAAFSLPTLRRLAHLEYLGLVDTPVLGNPWADPPEDGAPSEAEEGAWQRFWDFCAEHPPLRALGLDADRAEEAELTMQLLDALLALARRRPRLHIRRTPPRPWEQQYDWCRSSVRARGEFFYLWVSGVGGVLSLSVCARRQGGGGGGCLQRGWSARSSGLSHEGWLPWHALGVGRAARPAALVPSPLLAHPAAAPPGGDGQPHEPASPGVNRRHAAGRPALAAHRHMCQSSLHAWLLPCCLETATLRNNE